MTDEDIKNQAVDVATASEADLFQRALTELDIAIKSLEEGAYFNSGEAIAYFLTYIYLLWPEFHIYILDPFMSDGDEGGESGTTGNGTASLIPTANGYMIFDYGFALSTSVGEGYRSYCQGRLYETIQEMVAILAKRGVRKVSCIGRSDAMRIGWISCVDNNIQVENYEPNAYDFKVRERILALREKAKKLKQGQIMQLK